MPSQFNRSDVQFAAETAGNVVRVAFYGVGLFAFIAVGLVALWVWNRLPPSHASMKAQPVFQVPATALAQRPFLAKAENHPYGWVESVQYGQLYDRDADLTMLLIVPKEQYQNLTRSYASEIAALRPLAGRMSSSSGTFYDLETRFGSVRATEFKINADGRTKLCLSYLSRFDSPAFYLKGWFCEANGAKPSYRAVACIIDQLMLGKSLPSPEATAFIRERMARSPKCAAEPVSQTTDNGPRSQPLRRLIR